VLCAATAIVAPAQTFTTLLEFDNSDGNGPEGSLIEGVDGSFYGTTQLGGSTNTGCPEIGCGTAFRITADGVLKSAHLDSSEGVYPIAGLVLGTDGNFYGTADYGGANTNGCFGGSCGTVFEVTPTGGISLLYSFCGLAGCTDGGYPSAPLIQATDGSFYGTTEEFGINGGGTVFKITHGGALTTLYSFCALSNCADGNEPSAGLVEGTDGNFYGTTDWGGNPVCTCCGCGTVFSITPDGVLITLHSFDGSDGAYPGGLIQAPNGDFYGTTSEGGDLACNHERGCGTIFKMTPSGVLSTMHRFRLTDGAFPGGLVLATDGNFYALTSAFKFGGMSSDGTIFQITPQGNLTTLHTFVGTDGTNPVGLFQATNGTLYGATHSAGNFMCYGHQGCGTVFSLDMGLGPFVSFVRNPAKVRQTFGVLGQGFTGTTGVSLNGTPASFTVKSGTFLEATVPAGATTGYVTVATPTGTLTSNVPFHVIP
jgi:uncharacterized repeat protein (TIGR03803 family)